MAGTQLPFTFFSVGQAQLPARNPAGTRTIQVGGGENLFEIASKYLDDASQWWRISDLNRFPGQPPDFIVSQANTISFPTLLIPPVNPNAVESLVVTGP